MANHQKLYHQCMKNKIQNFEEKARKETSIYTITPLQSIFPKRNSFISCDFLSNFSLISITILHHFLFDFFCLIPFQLLFFAFFQQDISLIYPLLKKTLQSFFRSSFIRPSFLNKHFFNFFFLFSFFLLSIFQILFSKLLQNLQEYFFNFHKNPSYFKN